MKKLSFLVLILALSFSLLHSQNNPDQKDNPAIFGIGLSLNLPPTTNYYISFVDPGLDLVFNIGEIIRLEPGISYTKRKDEEDNSLWKFNNLKIGLKSALIFKREKLLITPGFYLGAFSEKRSRTEGSVVDYDYKQRGFQGGPVIGLEYLISGNFSFGSDIKYTFASYETTSISSPKSKASDQYLNGAIKLRFYF